MDIEMLDQSDKENVGPDVHYPTLPAITKSNISNKHPIRKPLTTKEPKLRTPSNTGRKRQRLSTLKDTPPRPSYSSQVSKIFTQSAPPKPLTRPPLRSLPQDSLRIFEHFNQAIRGEGSNKASPSSSSQPVYSSDTSDSNDDDVQRCAKSPPISTTSTPSEHPLTDLERAVASSFPPTPTREERRKTLHINSPANSLPPVPQASPSSVDDWTGDEIFYHPVYSRHLDHPGSDLDAPSRHDSPMQEVLSTSTKENFNPPRAPRAMASWQQKRGMSNRFRPNHAPVVRSPIAGVPLCMEEHPPSVGSDADDEDDEVEGVEDV